MDSDDPWDEDDGEELEAEIMRADRPFGVDLRGTTLEEALAGESLDEALAQDRAEGRRVNEALEVVDDGVPDVEGELVAEGFLVESGLFRGREVVGFRSAQMRRPAQPSTRILIPSTRVDAPETEGSSEGQVAPPDGSVRVFAALPSPSAFAYGTDGNA